MSQLHIMPSLLLFPFHGSLVRILPEEHSQAQEMEDAEQDRLRWEELDLDVLANIFGMFDIHNLIAGCGRVCSSWRTAACDPLLWRTLDLSSVKSNFIKIPQEPYVYVETRSDKFLTRILKIGLSQSHGSIETLILNHSLYISDDQLTYTAERSPKLKRLVMPAWNRIKKTGICKAVSAWKDLESLTMPYIANPPYLMEAIAKHCKRFSELKIMGPFDIFFASTLTAYLPGLKVLSLRCSSLSKDSLMIILDGLPQLRVLNISHCVLYETALAPAQKRILNHIDDSILQRASRLREFITCMSDSCIMCQRTRSDEGLMRWYKYEEDQWKADEVKSLAL